MTRNSHGNALVSGRASCGTTADAPTPCAKLTQVTPPHSLEKKRLPSNSLTPFPVELSFPSVLACPGASSFLSGEPKEREIGWNC